MADPHIDSRKRVRERIEPTVVHNTAELNGTNTVGTVRLDIVCQRITVELGSLTANVDGSINGKNFFSIAAAATGRVSYGTTAGNHLVKWVKITRTAGTDVAVVIGV